MKSMYITNMPEPTRRTVKTCDGVDPRDVLSREASRIKRHDLDSRKLALASDIESFLEKASRDFKAVLSTSDGIASQMGEKWRKYIKVMSAYMGDALSK